MEERWTAIVYFGRGVEEYIYTLGITGDVRTPLGGHFITAFHGNDAEKEAKELVERLNKAAPTERAEIVYKLQFRR